MSSTSLSSVAVGTAGALAPLPTISRLSPLVIRILGCNPASYTLQGTNTYLFGAAGSPQRLLLDCGEGKEEYITQLAKVLVDENVVSIPNVVFTHWHLDHTGGLQSLLESTQVRGFFQVEGGIKGKQAHEGEAGKNNGWKGEEEHEQNEQTKYFKLNGREGMESALTHLPQLTIQNINCVPLPQLLALVSLLHSKYSDVSLLSPSLPADVSSVLSSFSSAGFTVFRFPSFTILPFHTPGHTSDSICLFLVNELSIFSGDTILGAGSSVFRHLFFYMNSLQSIRSLRPRRIYPAHGPTLDDGVASVDAYIQHRMKREAQIVAFLSTASSALSAEQIVDSVYAELKLSASLKEGAMNNVILHLEKLEMEGKVESEKEAKEEKSDEIWTKIGWKWRLKDAEKLAKKGAIVEKIDANSLTLDGNANTSCGCGGAKL